MDDNNFQNYNENRNSVDRSRPMGLLLFLIFIKMNRGTNILVVLQRYTGIYYFIIQPFLVMSVFIILYMSFKRTPYFCHRFLLQSPKIDEMQYISLIVNNYEHPVNR